MVPYQHVQSEAVRAQKTKRRMHARKLRLQRAEQLQQAESQQRKRATAAVTQQACQAVADQQVLVDTKLDMQIRKAEKALQRAGKNQHAYGKKLLAQLYQKKAARDG